MMINETGNIHDVPEMNQNEFHGYEDQLIESMTTFDHAV
jgi:hypothetical protein